jgi:hypothetical protein
LRTSGQGKRVHHFRAVAIVVVVASALAASAPQAPDPVATWQRAKERLLADLDRMPRYTCVQTITRTYYEAPFRIHKPSCAALIAEQQARKHELSPLGWDRLRLDVALVEGKNVYSWVGAPRFTDETLEKLAGHGPLGSGDFGIFLREILLRGTVNFQREEVLDGRRLLTYTYDLPVTRSGYRIMTHDGWTLTGYSGTLLLDPEASDITRLTVRTAELPESSPACQAISEVTYGRTSIHERMVLIPRETRLRMIDRPGTESFSLTSFAGCREYGSSGRMVVDNPIGPAAPGKTPLSSAEPASPLPVGLRFTSRIVTPIDSDTAAAGDPVEAVLRTPMRDKKNSVVAPAGARLHGRLRRVEHRSGPPEYFEIVVQFESVEIDGRNVLLTATSYPPQHPVLEESVLSGLRLLLLNGSRDSATFFFRERHLRLKQLDSEWVTVSADAGKGKK